MIELNKIYNIDCVEGLKMIPDSSANIVITSLPYNVKIEYDVYKDYMAWQDYLNWIELWMTELYRILKDDGRCCINHYINFQDTDKTSRFPLFDIKMIQEKIGFNVYKMPIWNDPTRARKTAFGSWLSASSPYINTPYEGILISYKKQWKRLEKGESTISRSDFLEAIGGVWNLGTTRGKTKACFPVRLPQLCIDFLTYKGDTVLDPFMGSGTTAIAALRTGRNYIGFELSENYCNIANNWIEEEKIKLNLK